MNMDVENKDPAAGRESFSELLGRLFKYSAVMVHDEIELVTQGIREKVRNIRNAAFTVAAAVFISFAAFLSLCAALIIKLTSYMAPVYAALITAAALAFVGVVIGLTGYTQLTKSFGNQEKPIPDTERTTGNG
jgi:ABC-type transporter Mla maintaining outer membrane lipid asymmetry permease subunit MlaE